MVWAFPFSLATTKGITICFLFLQVLRCFNSLRCLLMKYVFFHKMLTHDGKRVSPFGNLRIFVYLRLPEAYRRLLRPSSALNANAFTVRPNSFYQFWCV